MNDYGMQKLAEWEGSVTKDGLHYPYDDATGEIVSKVDNIDGYLTIGYGHLLTYKETRSEMIFVDGIGYNIWDGISDEVAVSLFRKDITRFIDTVRENVTVPLTDNQFSALVSFCYNTGENAFETSTLLRLLNNGDYNEVPNQLRRWVYSRGKKIQGLVNRRNHEIELWNTP